MGGVGGHDHGAVAARGTAPGGRGGDAGLSDSTFAGIEDCAWRHQACERIGCPSLNRLSLSLPAALVAAILIISGCGGDPEPADPQQVLDSALSPQSLLADPGAEATADVESLGDEERVLESRSVPISPAVYLQIRKALAESGAQPGKGRQGPPVVDGLESEGSTEQVLVTTSDVHQVFRHDATGHCLLDCQVETGHLNSLGSRLIARTEFLGTVGRLTASPEGEASWRSGPEPTQALAACGNPRVRLRAKAT